MPLTRLQAEIFRVLAAHRDPESYVAGSTYLTRQGPRYSGDIDIFHDREDRVARAAQEDTAALEATCFNVSWQRRELSLYQAIVSKGGEETKLEWAQDADFRFYPAQRDPDFGYVLHPADLATNKMMAAAGRREPRVIVDLVFIHDHILPLGAVVWAAAGKSLGFTPEGLINEVRRLARYRDEDFKRVLSDPPVDGDLVMRRLRQALEAADAFVRRMPTEKIGLLFLLHGEAVQPDPDHLGEYATHAGARRGHWPSSSEVGSAMLERYDRKPGV